MKRSTTLEAKLTRDRLRDVLRYDPESGEFFWQESRSNRAPKGSRAGCYAEMNGRCYVILCIDGNLFFAHRVAWFFMTGEWIDEIDHKDGNGWNNRWLNLRRATHQENSFNMKLRIDNKTGVKGVSISARHRKPYGVWLNTKFIGRFSTLSEAKAARELAARKAHGEFYREQ